MIFLIKNTNPLLVETYHTYTEEDDTNYGWVRAKYSGTVKYREPKADLIVTEYSPSTSVDVFLDSIREDFCGDVIPGDPENCPHFTIGSHSTLCTTPRPVKYPYYSSERSQTFCTDMGHSAVYDSTSNTTFFEYMDLDKNNCVFTYNHTTGDTTNAVTVTTATSDGEHGHGAITIDEDGYIWVFSGCHETECKIYRSNNPRNPSAWTQKTSINNLTYPQAVPITGGVLVIARKTGSGTYPVSQYITTDNGSTWTETQLTNFGRATYPYMQKVGSTILLPLSYTSATYPNPFWGGCGMMYSDNEGSTWKKMNGDNHTLPVTIPNFDWIENSDNHLSTAGHLLNDGTKVAIYQKNTAGAIETVSYIGVWDDVEEEWVKYTVDDGMGTGSGAGNFSIYADETSIKVWGVKIIGGHYEVVEYTSTDNGETWTETELTTNSSYDNRQIYKVKNYSTPFLICNFGNSTITGEIRTFKVSLPTIP